MNIHTPVPVHVPAHRQQQVLVRATRDWTQPDHAVTPIHLLKPAQASSTGAQSGQPASQPVRASLHRLLPSSVSPTATLPARNSHSSSRSAAGTTSPANGVTGKPVAVVYFPLQSALPFAASLEHLDSLNADGHCYVVTGHADPTGAPRWTGPLSVARARAVMRTLMAAGAVQVDAVGKGAKPAPRADWPHERRADVVETSCK